MKSIIFPQFDNRIDGLFSAVNLVATVGGLE